MILEYGEEILSMKNSIEKELDFETLYDDYFERVFKFVSYRINNYEMLRMLPLKSFKGY